MLDFNDKGFNFNSVPVYSLDIETTSDKVKKSSTKIWSLGLTGLTNDGEEHFFEGVIDPVDRTKPPESMEDVLNKIRAVHGDLDKSFAEDQIIRDSFRDFVNDRQAGTLTTLDETMKNLGKRLKSSPEGILLIQNANFEQQALETAVERLDKFSNGTVNPQAILGSTKQSILRDIFKTTDGRHLIHTESSINNARKLFNNAARAYRSSGILNTGVDVEKDEFHKALNNLQNTIRDTVNNNMKSGKYTVVDLMDITKIYLGKLSVHGDLDRSLISTGTSVDFLVKNLLGDSKGEKHTAKSDAKQQTSIFEELSKRIDEIDLNKSLSNKDRMFVNLLSNSDEPSRTFIRGFANQIKEKVEDGSRKISKKNLENATQTMLDRYSYLAEKDNFSREAYAERVSSLADKHEFDAVMMIDEMRRDSQAVTLPNGVPEANSLAPKKGLSKTSQMFIAAGAIGAVALMSSSPKREKRKPDTYTELYDNVLLGQEYADWSERNNAHVDRYMV